MASLVNETPGHELILAAGRNADKLSVWSAKYHPSRVTTELSDACSDSEIDAVYVALPPNLHSQFSIMAMSAGKSVLCEKPLAVNETEAVAMLECASRTAKSLHHATSFPYHPRSERMRDIIRSGTLGSLRRITIACSSSHILTRGDDHRLTPDLGGGCLLDLGWYCVYATLWFTGLRPQSIAAFGTKDPATKIWTSAQALVQLEGGAVAHWDCGFDAAGRKWIEFAGSDASMICDDFLRPWDTQKPRFWIHGHDGKAACEIVGADASQESIMLDQFAKSQTQPSTDSIRLAAETQSILERWQQRLVDSSNAL
jgi:predicted dehydrogenase